VDATDFYEQAILEATFTGGAPLDHPQRYAGLFTTSPTDVGTDGVEVSAASYVRVPIPAATPSGGSVSNGVAIVWPPAAESWGTVTAIGIFDAITAGNLLLYETGLSDAIAAGQTASIGTGDLTVTVA